MIKKSLVLLLMSLWVITIAPAAHAQGRARGDDDVVVLTGRVAVPEGDSVGDIVIFDGPVNVEGTVEGDVVAFNGRVTVSGTVRGDVIVLNGRVAIEDGARVGGDVQSRTAAQISPDADVQGDVRGLDFKRLDVAFAAARFGFWVAVSISLLALTLLLVALFPRAADAVALAGTSRTGASIGWGLAAFFALPIVAILFLVTIVGIPLGVGLLLALGPLYALGYTAAAYFLGRRIVGPPRSRALAALLGVAILRLVALVPVLGGLTWFAATVFGLGLLFVAGTVRRSAETTRQTNLVT